MTGLMDRGRALLGKVRAMPSVLQQEAQRQQQIRPLIQSGQYRAAMGIPSAMEGFGTADVGAIGGLMGGIKAYHGSPHAFKQFDSKQIGTGEGAQAYGQGLYFAEAPGVARDYQRNLGKRGAKFGDVDYEQTWPAEYQRRVLEKDPSAKPFIDREVSYLERAINDAQISGKTHLEEMDLDLARRIKAMRGKKLPEGHIAFERAKHAERRKMVEEMDIKPYKTGSLYEVDIDAKPEQFLDYDAPLSQQPKAVREALESLGAKEMQAGPRRTEPSGGDVLQGIAAKKTGSYAKADDPGVSRALAEAGIPGIRYKDAMSRGSGGKDTSNYVVFPGQESRVRIDRINDQPTVMGQEAMLDAAGAQPGLMPPRAPQSSVMDQEAMLDAMTGGAATPPSMMPAPQGLMSGQGARAAGKQAALPKGTGGVNLKKIRQLFKASKDIGEMRKSPR